MSELYGLDSINNEPFETGSIIPLGWLKDQMQIQSDGLTGHIDEFWDSLGKNSAWLLGTGENWERGPYYLDGLLPLAYALDDNRLKQKAQVWIECMFRSQKEDGNFGPANNDDWWPRFVALKALVQYYELTEDERAISLMERYYGYMSKNIEAKPLHTWGKARAGDLLLCISWLYKRNHDGGLIHLYDVILRQSADWVDYFDNFPFIRPTEYYYDWGHMAETCSWDEINRLMQYQMTHAVNIAMGLKYPAMKYLRTGNRDQLHSILKGIADLTKYHGTANGSFNGDEHLAGNSPSRGSELCAVAELMFSFESLIDFFPESTLMADRIERLAFNALPATIQPDWWGHQYLQQANQVLVSEAKRDWFNNGNDANLFGLEPNFGCCAANMHQALPKLLSSLWHRNTDDGSVTAHVYAPSVLRFVKDGAHVSITEETRYPFSDRILFRIGTDQSVCLKLNFRIPPWCEEAGLSMDSRRIKECKAGTYVSVEEIFKDGDQIQLRLPMKPRITKWRHDAAAVEYGALVMSLKMAYKPAVLRKMGPCADMELYPASKWNYALVPDGGFEVIENENWTNPFDPATPPVRVKCKGIEFEAWKMKNNSADDVPQCPVDIAGREEDIDLVPYGCAKLRVTHFPWVKSGGA